MHTEMKDKIQKEYCRRVSQLTSLKLNGRGLLSIADCVETKTKSFAITTSVRGKIVESFKE